MRRNSCSARLPVSGFGAVVLAGALTFGGAAVAQSGSVSDAQVEANVLRALASSPQLATQAIKTTTVYGTVTLSGTVTDEAARTQAENLAARAVGVQKVVDELTLSSDAAGSQQAPAQPMDAGQNAQQGQVLQSDGTYAPAASVQDSGQQPSQAAQAPAPAAQQQTAPDWGPAGPPPGYSAQGVPNQQQGQGAPPVYRQPYYRNAPPSGYAQQQAPPPAGAQEAGKSVTIPSGALVRVRLVEGLTAKRIKAGTVFDGTVLNDVIADGEVAIPRGASVQGTIVQSNPSGAVGGKGQLALQLSSVSLSGKNYPIVSDTWTHYGRDKTGQTVGNAIGLGAFGALIGAVAGGGAGAAIGAAAGGAAGIGTSAATGRNDVVIPPEAILSFHLTQPAGVVTVSQAEMDRLGYGVQQSSLQRRPPPPPGYYGRPVYYPAPY